MLPKYSFENFPLLVKRSFGVLPAALSLILSLNFFWSKPLVPGFDTPFYLTEIRTFSHGFSNPLTYPYLDRYLTIAFPGILSRIFGFDPITSYRIAITAIYIAIALVLFRLFKNLTHKSSAAAVLSSALVVSPFLITYSSMLFANFTGFLVLFSFFAIETSRDFKYKRIVLGVILGLIFYIHNFSTVSFGLIIATYYFLKLLITKDTKTLRDVVIVFIVAALIGFVGLSRYLNINLAHIGNTSTNSIKIVVPTEPFSIGKEWQLILNAINEYSSKYWLYFFSAFSLISFVAFRKEIVKNKKNFLIPFAIFIPSFILIFQPLLKLSFLPERFATLVSLSTYFFYIATITLPKFKKVIIPLAALPLLFNYLGSDNLILNKGYRAFSNEEIGVYKDIKPLIDPQGIVMVPSDHYYWTRYFLDGLQIESGEHFVSCGTVTEQGYFGEANFTLAKFLDESDVIKAADLLKKLKSLFPNKKLYFISDTGLSCGNGKIMQKLGGFKQIFHHNNWYLYETI